MRPLTTSLAGLIALGFVTAAPLALRAADPVPHAFSNGQIADANEVNANFNHLVNHFGAMETLLQGSTDNPIRLPLDTPHYAYLLPGSDAFFRFTTNSFGGVYMISAVNPRSDVEWVLYSNNDFTSTLFTCNTSGTPSDEVCLTGALDAVTDVYLKLTELDNAQPSGTMLTMSTLPDLTVEITAVQSAISVDIDITNTFDASARLASSKILIDFYLDPGTVPSPGDPADATYTVPLAVIEPGVTTNKSFMDPGCSGSGTAYAIIDPDDAIDELDDIDNNVSAGFSWTC